MIKQVIIRYTNISTIWRVVSASIIAPKQICTLPEPKGCIIFYGSYTSCGTPCPLGRMGPQYSLLIIKGDKKGLGSEKLYF